MVEKTTYIIPQKGVKHNAEGKEKPQAGTAHQANHPAYGHHEPHRGADELDRQADRMRKGGDSPAIRIAHAALSVNTFQHEKREEKC